MACSSIQGGLLLQLPSAGAKNLLSNNTATFSSHNCSNNRSSRRCSKISRPSFFTRDFRPQLDDYPEGIISGEWTENFSLLSYDDLRAYIESQDTPHKVRPSSLLGEIMSTAILTATANQTLEEVNHHFEAVSWLPVVDSELRCIGVVAKKDMAKASPGTQTKVAEVMSSPAITLSPEKTVMDATALMLKMKIHRIPILNKEGQVIGTITSTDILEALAAIEE